MTLKKVTDPICAWTTTNGMRYDHYDFLEWPTTKLLLCRHKTVAESPLRPNKVLRKASRVKGHWSSEHQILRNSIKLLKNRIQNFSLRSTAFSCYSQKKTGRFHPPPASARVNTPSVREFSTGQNDFLSHSSVKGLVRSENNYNTLGNLDSPLGPGYSGLPAGSR